MSATTFAPSPRRIAANQQNAQHSTGPKSKEGKARSSQNASSHRLYSAYLLQEGEDESFFISFRDGLLGDLFPKNFLELAQADRIISLHWKLRRHQSAENHLNEMQNQLFQEQEEEREERIANKRERHLDRCEKLNLTCTQEDLNELGLAERDPDGPPLIPEPGFFLAQSLFNTINPNNSKPHHPRITPQERLLNIESKLQSLLTKAMKDYRQLQKDRQAQEQADAETEDDGTEPYSPFLTRPTTTDEDDDDNCGVAVSPADSNEDDCATDTTDNGLRTTDTKVHPAQHSATTPPPPRQNEATCHNDSSPSIHPNSNPKEPKN